MISELLGRGRDNAIPTRELMNLTGLNQRLFYTQLEKERRSGIPICASKYNPRGLYLPDTVEELNEYCGMLDRTAKSIRKTRLACLKAAEKVDA